MVMPPLPKHPETWMPGWTRLERQAIQEYGQLCRKQALEEALLIFENTRENTRQDAIQAIKELI